MTTASTIDLLTQSFDRFYTASLERVPNLLAALSVLIIALIVRYIVHRTTHVVLTRTTRRKVLAARIVETTILAAGVLLSLSLLGISLTGLLTGVGLVTVGLSFALQDLIVNFVAGLELLGNAPFELGDQIEVGDVRGRVRSIGSRTTVIESNDGSLVTVPNRDLLTKAVAVQRKPQRKSPTSARG